MVDRSTQITRRFRYHYQPRSSVQMPTSPAPTRGLVIVPWSRRFMPRALSEIIDIDITTKSLFLQVIDSPIYMIDRCPDTIVWSMWFCDFVLFCPLKASCHPYPHNYRQTPLSAIRRQPTDFLTIRRISARPYLLQPISDVHYPPPSYPQRRQVIRQTSIVLHQFWSTDWSDLTTDVSSDLAQPSYAYMHQIFSSFPILNHNEHSWAPRTSQTFGSHYSFVWSLFCHSYSYFGQSVPTTTTLWSLCLVCYPFLYLYASPSSYVPLFPFRQSWQPSRPSDDLPEDLYDHMVHFLLLLGILSSIIVTLLHIHLTTWVWDTFLSSFNHSPSFWIPLSFQLASLFSVPASSTVFKPHVLDR